MAPVVRVTASDKVLSVVTAGATRTGGGSSSVTVGVKGDINVVTADGDWQIVAGSIVNADIAAGAAIAQSKVANLTTDLAAKAASAHSHGASEISALDAGDVTTGIFAIGRIPTGTTGTTVPFGNDSRFTDSRAPSGAAAGDLSGTYPNPTVSKLNGVTVTGTPTVGQVPIASSGTAAAWGTAGGGAPSGAAAGDLSGTYPNPTVAKVNGVAVTGTPTSGQVPIASSGTAAAWGTVSGGTADADRINAKASPYNAVGDAERITATVTAGNTALTVASGAIPAGFTGTNVYTIVILGAGAGGTIPHVTKFTRTGASTGTLQTASATTVSGAVAFIGTDDTVALNAARDAWLASAKDNAIDGRIATKSFYIPPGCYIYTGSDLFMTNLESPNFTIRSNLVEGSLSGPGTRIVFANTQTATQDRTLGNLMSLKWRALNFRMENMEIYGCNPNLTFAWLFCSALAGGQGNFTWRSISLDGTWKSGWAFDGDRAANMNSEQHFDHCTTRYGAQFARALIESSGTTETTVAAASDTAVLSSTVPGTLNVTDATYFPVSTHAISNRLASGTSRTLTVPTNHNIFAGTKIEVAGINANYDGFFSVVSVTTTTITYTHGNTLTEGSIASGGTMYAGSEGVIDTGTTGWRKFSYANKTGTTLTGVIGPGSNNPMATGDRVVHAPDQADQFVNYDFFGCNFEYRKGDALRFWKGGHIRVFGGSWILGISESGGATDTGSFFDFPYASDFDGAGNLLVMGTRFEKRTTGVQLLDTSACGRNHHYTFDTISFLSVGTGYTYADSAIVTLNKNIETGFDRMPYVTFRNSDLSGHILRTGWNLTTTNVELTRGGVAIDMCNILDTANSSVAIPTSGAANSTGIMRWANGLPLFRITDTAGVPNVSRGMSLVTAPAVTALTDAATIAVNCDTTAVGTVTLAGNRTLGAPTGTPANGQRIEFRIKQDGTGSRTLAYNAIYRFSTGLPSPTLTTAINQTDRIVFEYNSLDTKWDCLSVIKGYA